ncbi:4Fe-4S binding protein [Neolewinella antarctica]|uniref:Polyferredoxin n=1 Tax=Neolewinella antarctica TaxID=442734 RepID=A0ABX0XDR7_9BACT|nr:4Fe-4S dicluster domain-containing protein [Neolewinella antarctica]NJC27049.1 polyferredoxin [Neolewinella antarctica]
MPSTSTKKSVLQYVGLALFAIALLIFTFMLSLDNYQFNAEDLVANLAKDDAPEVGQMHQEALRNAAEKYGLFEETYTTTFSAQKALKQVFYQASADVDATLAETGIPEGKEKWEVELPKWQFKSQLTGWMQNAASGPVSNNPLLFFFLTIGLAALGGLLYIIPKFQTQPGIKHNHIYHSQLTKGLDLGWRSFFLAATTLGILVYGFYYMDDKWIWPAATGLVAAIIIGLVLFAQHSFGRDVRDAGPEGLSSYLGIFAGLYFMGFYVLLYWASQHVVGWVAMVSPISEGIYQAVSGNDSGGEASQWFLYGLMYTTIMIVMGVRMISKYRHNKYQVIRTISVMFFQLSFAFMIPEVLLALNKGWYGDKATLPYQDLKSIWPLDYDFFFDWSIKGFVDNPGSLGVFIICWGIFLVIVGVPLMVHLVGKRWYCSWVCGCGGLAETMGDPWRQLSDKSVRAWKFERIIVNGVLVFATLMTAATIYSFLPNNDYWFTRSTFLIVFTVLLLIGIGFTVFSYLKSKMEISRLGISLAVGVGVAIIALNLWTFTMGSETYLFGNTGAVQKWYGFLIGAGFAGVVGTGFYPLMGNRVWCRFGCPLAAYLGLVQRFQSRFRITTNGGQCISCGNCSTYCEMGIDVRAYAMKGQDIVRSSCVGCGVCAAVCPRGVLRLENGSADIGDRAVAERNIHIEDMSVEDNWTERPLAISEEGGISIF